MVHLYRSGQSSPKNVMKYQNTAQKYIAAACGCILIFALTSQPASAARRSRLLPITLFVSGMGLQFGSRYVKASAQDRYDTYLNAAIQADIQTHKDDFLARRNASTMLSRVGLGCVGLAVILSIYDQLRTREDANATEEAGLSTHAATPLPRLQHFSPPGIADFRPLRPTFQLQPHYDLQTGQASLRLQHFF